MQTNQVVLVNENDEVVGVEDKLLAHQKGLKHRAISVLVFNELGEWLLQKRAANKYHSGNLWTNTCCSHPYPEEDIKLAAIRRLEEEMGIFADVEYLYSFNYEVELDNNLIENELDHVFIARTNQLPILNENEASDYKYVSTKVLKEDIEKNPQAYTEWFKMIFEKLKDVI
jgi:isopentenyl-diphosphate delta-isomerase